MRISLIYELQMEKPWDDNAEYRTYWNAMEQIELADSLGFDTVWEVEHHFLSEYSHSSAPEVFLSSVAQRTKNIRIGEGVALLPGPFNHPVRIAERAAALDIMSNGRLEFGTGRSITEQELGGFEIDPADSRPMWEEAVEMIPKMWTEDPFSWEGKYYHIPPRSVLPKPIQKPHPRMWVACTQPDTFRIAGEKGLGALAFGFSIPGALEATIALYRGVIANAQPVGAFVNSQFAASTIMHCAETDDAAKEWGANAAQFYRRKSEEFWSPWKEKAPASYQFYSDMWKNREALRAGRGDVTIEEMIENGAFCVGSPETCLRVMRKYEAVGVDEVICLVQVGRIPHEKVMRSLELFGRQVLPALRAGAHASAPSAAPATSA